LSDVVGPLDLDDTAKMDFEIWINFQDCHSTKNILPPHLK